LSSLSDNALNAKNIIEQIGLDTNKAKDNLFQAKVFQAHFANEH
jgi:hypothetical protein